MPGKNRNRIKNKRKTDHEDKVPLREKVIEALELPKEIVLNIPKLTLVGNGSLIIENYKGIIEYESEKVRVNTGSGMISITGKRLYIKEITSENLYIEGDIHTLEFIK